MYIYMYIYMNIYVYIYIDRCMTYKWFIKPTCGCPTYFL